MGKLVGVTVAVVALLAGLGLELAVKSTLGVGDGNHWLGRMAFFVTAIGGVVAGVHISFRVDDNRTAGSE